MTPWALLAVPGTVVLLMGLLCLSALVEDRMLSPHAVVGAAVRSRHASPDTAEVLTAQQFQTLLARRPRPAATPASADSA